jgi:2-oxo-4-hydroxy-4-carboxy-5-ureidoimidazoline decarboxylase
VLAAGNRENDDVPITLTRLNACSAEEFVSAVGRIFEHSPWIAAAVEPQRPFTSREALHAALCDVVRASGEERQIALIRAHPDLVGREVRRHGGLTAESTREQTAAGLMDLSAEDIARFDRYNTAYTARFGFPFVICARQNKKEAILRAFPERLEHTRDEEIAAALAQIFEIARLRLEDLIPSAAGDDAGDADGDAAADGATR